MDLKTPYKTLKQIIELAKHRNQLEEQYFPGIADFESSFAFMASPEGKKVEDAGNRLDELLDSLLYDELLEVESLMLYGRGDFTSYEECLSYMKWRYPDESGKSMAVEYIASKGPLDEYLESALKRLCII